jgi:hypothetical protein
MGLSKNDNPLPSTQSQIGFKAVSIFIDAPILKGHKYVYVPLKQVVIVLLDAHPQKVTIQFEDGTEIPVSRKIVKKLIIRAGFNQLTGKQEKVDYEIDQKFINVVTVGQYEEYVLQQDGTVRPVKSGPIDE